MRTLVGLGFALALAACAPTGATVPASHSPDQYAAALADPQRPQADRDRDAARMPAAILAFAQVDPGEKVA